MPEQSPEPSAPRPPVGPVDGRLVPRFAGAATFARLPEVDRVSDYDVAILGVPFDNGTSYPETRSISGSRANVAAPANLGTRRPSAGLTGGRGAAESWLCSGMGASCA